MDSDFKRHDQRTGGLRLGNLAMALLAAQALTGLALLFHYRPTTASAYLDLLDLREVSRLGFVRALHRWGSHAAVIVVWLHLLRTALAGTHGSARRRAWYFAVALTLLTVLLATTGYLLPWDQDAYWGLVAVTSLEATSTTSTPTNRAVATTAVGEAQPTAASGERWLLSFYVLHSVVLPLLATALIVIFYRRLSWRHSRR